MKRLGWWIWIPIAIVIVALGVLGDAYFQERQYEATLKSLQTQALTRGAITASVSATGSLAARQTAALSFGVNGQVGPVNVKLGDKVNKGQILATLDPSSVPSNVSLAEQDLVTAQQNLQTAQTSLTAEANAEVALANAQATFNGAQKDYNNIVLNNGPAALNAAKNDLQIAKAHYDTSPTGENYTLYMQALNTYETLNGIASQYQTSSYSLTGAAPTTVASVTAEYNLAKSQLADAQAALKNYQKGISPEAVTAAQAQVAADESTIQEAEILAPFDGTVTALNLLPGDLVTAGTSQISLADRSQLHVDIPISELDISTISVGQSAALNFDAFPSKNYNGQVTAVSTDPAIASGSVTYTVRVVIQNPDSSLLPGMTAGVTIVTQNLSNVFVVPTRALRTVNGLHVLYEIQDSQLAEVPVQLGVSNDTQTQVTGRLLEVGQTIVVNPTSAVSSGTVGMFGLGRIFGGAGGGAAVRARVGGF